MSDWSKLLAGQGDPVEKEGCEKYLLHEKFPRYAEIWGPYVYPNRRPKLPSKFREGFPVELEELFNHHYGVWFHLTIVYRQIEALSQSNVFVDVSDPLVHLATAIDLIQSTFVIALEIRYGLDGQKIFKKFTPRTFEKYVKNYWKKDYPRGLKNWNERRKPVEIRLHSTKALFDRFAAKHIKRDVRRKFNHVSNESIKPYRNILAHSLPPLRDTDEETGKICIPKKEYLPEYAAALWSSERSKYDPKHYELAEVVIGNLADELVLCTNELWEALLEIVQEITLSKRYQHWFAQNDKVWNYDTLQRMWNYNPTADEQKAPSGSTPLWVPNKPSAYNDD